ncbi:MAG TPA: hypothetical protein VKD71_13955, partial [Gemmataceae bacterium]|nr:hypothetical protein [Gemmataceae bacterium]
ACIVAGGKRKKIQEFWPEGFRKTGCANIAGVAASSFPSLRFIAFRNRHPPAMKRKTCNAIAMNPDEGATQLQRIEVQHDWPSF